MKKEKKNKKIGLTVFIIICIVMISFSVLIIYGNRTEEIIQYAEINDIARTEDINTLLQSQYQPLRNYGAGIYKNQSFNIDGIFNKLPPIPKDMWRYRHMLSTGQILGDVLCELTPDYYTQPELYPNFVTQHIKPYKYPDPYHWTPRGYGTYPADMETIMGQGDFVEVCTFFYTGFSVETYQGFGLQPIYPTKFTYNKVNYIQNPEQVKEYLTVEITPKNILLEPAYLMFEKGWSQKITVKVISKENTPKGIYQIGFNPIKPDLDLASIWQTKYTNKFRNGPGGFGVDRPQFLMVVRIEAQA